MERNGAKVGEVYLSKVVRLNNEYIAGEEYRAYTQHAFECQEDELSDEDLDVLSQWKVLGEALEGYGESPRAAEDALLSLVTDEIKAAAVKLEMIDFKIDQDFYEDALLPTKRCTFEATCKLDGSKEHFNEMYPEYYDSDLRVNWFVVFRNVDGDIIERIKLGDK